MLRESKIVDTLAKYRTALTDALAEIKVTRIDLKTTFQNRLSGQIIRGGVSFIQSKKKLAFS